MTEDKFQRLKADLFAKYGKFFCEDAIADINAANNIIALISVLHKYAWDTWHKDYTATRWLRKWFEDDLEVFNENGCYLDQVVTLTNPDMKTLMFFGKCFANVIYTEPLVSSLYVQDEARLNICAQNVCSLSVYTKSQAQSSVLYKHRNAQIKIRTNK